jgi:hypothetical protein
MGGPLGEHRLDEPLGPSICIRHGRASFCLVPLDPTAARRRAPRRGLRALSIMTRSIPTPRRANQAAASIGKRAHVGPRSSSRTATWATRVASSTATWMTSWPA